MYEAYLSYMEGKAGTERNADTEENRDTEKNIEQAVEDPEESAQ